VLARDEAVRAYNAGEFDKAIALATKGINADPGSAELFSLRCKAYISKNDLDTALKDCAQAISLDARNVGAYCNRGNIFLKKGEAARAIDDSNKALALDPANTKGLRYYALFNLAGAYLKKGEVAKALARIDAAIAAKDNSIPLYELRAEINLAAKRPNAARLDLQQALKLAPAGKAEKYRKKIAEIDGNQRETAQEVARVQPPAVPEISINVDTPAPSSQVEAPKPAGEESQPISAPAAMDTDMPAPYPEPPARPEQVQTPGVQGVLDDPCGRINLPEGDDAEALPPDGSGPDYSVLQTPLAQSVNQFTKGQWAAAVTVGRGAMEKLLGPLPAEEERKFQASWAQMADYPSRRVVAYLDRLNPLLVEFLSLTQAAESMLAALEQAKYEAQMAAAYESENGAREAMQTVGNISAQLKSLKARIGAVSSAVAALGEPPNPLEDKCRARRRAKKAFNAFKNAGGAWKLLGRRTRITRRMDDYRISKADMTFGENTARAISVVPGKYYGKGEDDGVISWNYTWTVPPKLIADQDTLRLLVYIKDAGVVYGDGRCWGKIYLRAPHHLADSVLYNGMIRAWKEEYKVDDKYATSGADEGWGVGDPKFLKWKEEKFESGAKYTTVVTEAVKAGGVKRIPASDVGRKDSRGFPVAEPVDWTPEAVSDAFFWPKLHNAQPGWTMTIEVALNTAYISGAVYYDYVFDPDLQSPQPMPTPPGATKREAMKTGEKKTGEKKPDDKKPEDKGPLELTDEELAQADLKGKVEFHQNNINLLQGDLARYQQMMGSAADEGSRKAIQSIITGKMADLQAEQDAITTMKTGQFTRTRTPWDEMVSAQMEANGREVAGKIQEDNHRRETMDRLINLLPEHERESTRQWAENQLGPGAPDPEKLKKVARIVGEKGQALNMAGAAKYDEVAANQQVVIDTLENYQTAARMTMYATPFVSGGATLALAYGLTSGGVTGYQTGGLLGEEHAGWGGAAVGSVTTAARFWSSSIDYGLTFYEGYKAPGAGGEEAGVMGGLQNVAVTFIERKITGAITKKIVRYQAQAASAAKQANLDAWRGAQRTVDFRQQRDYGKAMVERHQEMYQDFKDMKRAGAPADKLRAAEQKLMDQTAAIKQAPHAKGYLKFNATEAQQAAYNSTSRLHTGRIVQELKTELGRQGFDNNQLSFRPIRNAGNTSPGMDLDLAMYSSMGNKVTYKDPNTGKTNAVDIYTANATVQKIFDKVYAGQSGGRTAHASWQMVTSGKHLEAYSDPNWLRIKCYQKDGLDPLAMVDPRYAADAARVTEVKAHEIRQQAGLGKDNQNWEIFRGTAKDIGSKVLPNIQARLAKTTDPAVRNKLNENLKFYARLQAAMETANHDPVAAQQRIKTLTGYEAVDVVHMTSAAIESLGKWK
jgi:tetratricopeptide (TPR) repeat protein